MEDLINSHSAKIGFSFGLTSATITTLGVIIGLSVGTGSRLAVIGGVLTVALADAFSDGLGIHLSEESEGVHTTKEIWLATISTFLTKLVFALTFAVPVIFLESTLAIIVSVFWGAVLLSVFSYHLAMVQKEKPYKVILEHLVTALIVIVASYFVGTFIKANFS